MPSLTLVIIVAIVGGLGFIFWPQLSQLQNYSSQNTRATSTTLGADTSGRVVVNAQSAGETVQVDAVAVDPPGVWVAVLEITAGELGNVLGAARARMPATNISVPLLRATLPSREYAVVLYRDNGDDLFDHEADSVYVDFDTGKPVIAPFSTTP